MTEKNRYNFQRFDTVTSFAGNIFWVIELV